jgi:UDP-glucose 4-epimerase
MRILITGGAGFIGSHIAEHFQDRAEVRVLDNLHTGYRRNLAGLEHEFLHGSVLDRDLVRAAVAGVDYVFHLAALVSVPESMEKPAEYAEVNTQGTLVVLEEAARAGVRKLCFSSSAAVYGDSPAVPKRETAKPEPGSPYAQSKLDGEHYCNQFRRAGRLDTACLRYFNVFGPRQDPRGAYAAAVPVFIQRAMRNEALILYGDGEQTRDFIYVKDVVAANDFLARSPAAAGVFNVACGGAISIKELARRIIGQTASASKLTHAAPRAGDVRHSLAAIGKLRDAGFEAARSFDEGIAETIAYQASGLPGTGG